MPNGVLLVKLEPLIVSGNPELSVPPCRCWRMENGTIPLRPVVDFPVFGVLELRYLRRYAALLLGSQQIQL